MTRVIPHLVLAFGTFDLLHRGHRRFLRQAARLGTSLTVVVARDRNVHRLKGHAPVQTEQQRLRVVKRLPYVTHAVLGQREFNHRYALVRKLKPDTIALGYDQRTSLAALARDLRRLGLRPKLVRCVAFRPERYKSSLLRRSGKRRM